MFLRTQKRIGVKMITRIKTLKCKNHLLTPPRMSKFANIMYSKIFVSIKFLFLKFKLCH